MKCKIWVKHASGKGEWSLSRNAERLYTNVIQRIHYTGHHHIYFRQRIIYKNQPFVHNIQTGMGNLKEVNSLNQFYVILNLYT
jgi:hypothetical protein